MDLNLKEMRLFATEAEREQARKSQIEKDMQYGNPEVELDALHTVSKNGVWVFHLITAASTTAFAYRVMSSHLYELFGWWGTVASMAISIICALVIERILGATWKPALKKIFNTGKLDVTLFAIGTLFTILTFIAALAGVRIIAEDSVGNLQQESVVTLATNHQAAMADIDSEIKQLKAGKVKGYSWKGRPTEKAISRIKVLEAQKTQQTEAFQKVTEATTQANAARENDYGLKLKKAQGYLGFLAIFAEIIKLIIYCFLGYWSLQLRKWHSGETETVAKIVITRYNNNNGTEPTPSEDEDFDNEEEYDWIQNAASTSDMSLDEINHEIFRTQAKINAYRSKYQKGKVTDNTYKKKVSEWTERINELKDKQTLIASRNGK
jgi:predicted transcriptional regulator